MCGLAGIIEHSTPVEQRQRRIKEMLKALTWRGPDDQGEYHDQIVSFAHRRLSILDLSDLGHQPMSSSSGRLTIVYNGEIYNYRELVSELQKSGYSFSSTSDTEMILHAFEHWGVSALQKFNGMFAFAIFDRKQNELILVRDRYGKKPLYYFPHKDGLVFASTLSALLKGTNSKLALNKQGLLDYVSCGYLLPPRCLFEGVKQVQPGEMITFNLSPEHTNHPSFQSTYYYCLSDRLAQLSSEETPSLTEQQTFEGLLDKAVTSRLISDRPIGLFLSGGIDSSVISALAREHMGDRVHAFCCAFEQESFSEHTAAQVTADFLNVELHTSLLKEPNLADLQEMIHRLGEPLGDSSYIAMSFLCSCAKQFVDVVLSGDGADELLGGYDTYYATRLARNPMVSSLVSTQLILPLLVKLCGTSNKKVGLDYKLRAFLNGLSYEFPVNHFAWRMLCPLENRSRLLNPDWLCDMPLDITEQTVSSLECPDHENDWLRHVQDIDFQTWLPNDILPKVDMSSMAHGLEIRSPYLDYRLVEYCWSLPAHSLRNGKRGKIILRELAKKLLPPSTIKRKKQGFNAPVNVWFRNSLKNTAWDIFSEAERITEGAIRAEECIRILKEHDSRVRDHGFLLWSLLVLLLWLEQNN